MTVASLLRHALMMTARCFTFQNLYRSNSDDTLHRVKKASLIAKKKPQTDPLVPEFQSQQLVYVTKIRVSVWIFFNEHILASIVVKNLAELS